jgi:hypothetical protein
MSEVIIWCPQCRSEYREGFVICSDCDVPLVSSLDSEEGDELAPIARETSPEFIGELVEELEREEIPYVIQAGTAVRYLDDATGSETATPHPWEARVWVTNPHATRAAELHEELTAKRRAERGAEVLSRYDSRTE